MGHPIHVIGDRPRDGYFYLCDDLVRTGARELGSDGFVLLAYLLSRAGNAEGRQAVRDIAGSHLDRPRVEPQRERVRRTLGRREATPACEAKVRARLARANNSVGLRRCRRRAEVHRLGADRVQPADRIAVQDEPRGRLVSALRLARFPCTTAAFTPHGIRACSTRPNCTESVHVESARTARFFVQFNGAQTARLPCTSTAPPWVQQRNTQQEYPFPYCTDVQHGRNSLVASSARLPRPNQPRR